MWYLSTGSSSPLQQERSRIIAKSSRSKALDLLPLTIHAIQSPDKHIKVIRTGDYKLILRSGKGAALHGAGIEVFIVVKGAQRLCRAGTVQYGRQAAMQGEQQAAIAIEAHAHAAG